MRHPKPVRRGPKPRKALKRSAPVRRNTKPIRRGKPPARVRQRDSRGALRELADDWMSLFIRTRGGWVCQRCGSRKWERMQNAHLVRKARYPAGRYRTDNAICLCAECHSYFTHSEIEWREWLVSWMGEKRLADLEAVCRMPGRPHDYRAVILFFALLMRDRPDRWKVQERFDALARRSEKLGVVV